MLWIAPLSFKTGLQQLWPLHRSPSHGNTRLPCSGCAEWEQLEQWSLSSPTYFVSEGCSRTKLFENQIVRDGRHSRTED